MSQFANANAITGKLFDICVCFIVLQIKDMRFFLIQVHGVSVKQDVLKDIQLPCFNDNSYTYPFF